MGAKVTERSINETFNELVEYTSDAVLPVVLSAISHGNKIQINKNIFISFEATGLKTLFCRAQPNMLVLATSNSTEIAIREQENIELSTNTEIKRDNVVYIQEGSYTENRNQDYKRSFRITKLL